MRCDDASGAMPLLVLGALNPAEAKAVESHCGLCARCREELSELQAVVRQLPPPLPEVSPPNHVRARLEAFSRPRRAGRWLTRLAPAAAAALLLTNALTLVALNRQSLSIDRAQAELGLLRHNAHLDYEAVQALGGSGRIVPVYGQNPHFQAYGLLRVSADQGEVALVLYGLPAAPEGKSYQGWLRRGSERISIGLINPDPWTREAVIRRGQFRPEVLAGIEGFGITLEPAGGSQQPTGARVAGTERPAGL